MSVKMNLLDLEEERWEHLFGLFEKIPDWEQPGVADGWSVKDLIAHIAAWHAKTIDRLETRRMTGALPPPPDVEAFNAVVYEENRDLSIHDMKVMSASCRHRFREEVAMLNEDDAKEIEPLLHGNADGHYDEHIEQLDRYLAKGKA